MSFSSMMLLLSMCSFFFVILFTLEGFSDDGLEGIRIRHQSIVSCLSCGLLTLALFLVFNNL